MCIRDRGAAAQADVLGVDDPAAVDGIFLPQAGVDAVDILCRHKAGELRVQGDTARQFNAADTRQPVLLHRVCGAGLRLRPEGGEGAYKPSLFQ